MNSSHKINSIIYLNAIPIAERELSMQSLESVIIFHKFNKQMNTQKLKRKKKRGHERNSPNFFSLKNCKKILIKGSHPHYKRIHQEPGKQN